MFEAIGQGIVTGLVLATFFGPVFFAVLDLGLKGNIRGAAFLAFGTFVSDILWVLFIFLLAWQVNKESLFMRGMYVAGGLVLIAIGLQSLFRSTIKAREPQTTTDKNSTLFLKGFAINTTNPNVFFFWFGAVMLAANKYGHQSYLVVVHFFSALLVVFSTDFLKGYAASFFRHRVSNELLILLSRLSGLLFVYFGLKLIFFH